jgi:hypothetical protein
VTPPRSPCWSRSARTIPRRSRPPDGCRAAAVGQDRPAQQSGCVPAPGAGLNAVLSFWIAYILTRPLGASIGDYLSQPTGDGGLGFGTVVTSVLFLAVILGLVVYLTVTRRDVAESERLTPQEG